MAQTSLHHSTASVGHRQRIMQRYEKTALEGFADYEVLELALTLIIPRVDTKGIAKALLKRFGSITAIVQAPVRELQEVAGLGKTTALRLRFLGDFQSFCLQENFVRQDYIRSQKDVTRFLAQHFSDRVDEYAVVFYLDNQNRVMTVEVIAEGSVDHCTVYPRKVFDKALQAGAASILLAHNHPGGSKEPSEADWELTEKLLQAGQLLAIELIDHIIVASGSTVSLRGMSRWVQKG